MRPRGIGWLAAPAVALLMSAAFSLLWVRAAMGAAPPFEPPQPERRLYDLAAAFPTESRRTTNQTLRDLEARSDARVVVYTHVKPQTVGDVAAADADAAALLTEWDLDGDEAAALVWAFDRDLTQATVGVAVSEGFGAKYLDIAELRTIVDASTSPDLDAGRWLAALTRSTVALSAALPSPTPGPAGPSPSAPPSGPAGSPAPTEAPVAGNQPAAGPPYPDPVDGQVVYDFAAVLEPATEAAASETIERIEERTGAEVVVYTQVKPASDTVAEAEQDAIALIDQWGVGREGFDDGLAILFDMAEPSGCHGQVQLYAGPGFRQAFLTNEERQRVYETDMLPLLRACDVDGALTVALEGVEAGATPEHAASLRTARQIDAVLGLVMAPLVFLLLVAWAGSSWWRYGKDPVYLDDASILMPGPPPELTAASGALLHDGRSSRHTLSTAMVDLASRGEIAFMPQDGLLGDKVAIAVLEADEKGDVDPAIARNRRRPLGRAELYALERLRSIARDKNGLIEPDELLRFGSSVDKFDDRLEAHVAERGWFREPPAKASERWTYRAAVELVAGVAAIILGFVVPSSGSILIGVAIIAASAITFFVARSMPARTLSGAMLFAMLAAYRRTLGKTMEQARSMDQVVQQAGLPWIDTPDRAAVWGVALGLQEQVESVLERSVDDLRSGRVAPGAAWTPLWYGGSSSSAAGSPAGVTSAGVAPGLFSASVVPEFGGMMAAISTIGNSPASSGSGGFSGGSSGGGGGGAGGGF